MFSLNLTERAAGIKRGVRLPQIHHQKRKTAEPTENFSVISKNYSKAPDTNLSPKECTEYRDEFGGFVFKLMGFSVLLMFRILNFC
jgi:hypothetical protein